MSAASSSASTSREVDYYLNPTELFRWINYRRWDGAKSRAQSHPDECSTWIVSRHNTDGRILWRHLPLHLICMQKEAACGVVDESDVQAVVANRQMEQFMDVLLDSYPEGASSPDDQGMLPLHLLLSKSEGEPNERTINLLLSSFPNAVDIRDKFGRTPHDILKESCGTPSAADGAGATDPAGAGASDRTRAAFRALKRARYVSDRITATIRDESANIVAAVQHEASNERGASQKIIVRLEEELNKCRKEMDERDGRERDVQGGVHRIKSQLAVIEGKADDANRNLDVTRKERDELLSSNEAMKAQLDSHDDIVERIRLEAERNRQSDLEAISSLKSEANTSKAMTEALESQLRSRFTNEEYLSTSVTDLEEQLEELKVRSEHAAKKHGHEVESLTADNKRLKWNADELSKKNASLHEKLKELNKQMSQIISSYSALNSEHDRLLELSQTYEGGLLESIRSERADLVEHFAKQRELVERTLAEQERIVQESLVNQDKLVSNARSDRNRGKGVVEKLRNEFQQLRAAAAERERTIHAEELATSRRLKRNSSSGGGNKPPASSSSRSPGRSESESIASASGESRNPRATTAHSGGHRSSSRGRPIHPAASASSSTADGHLVRLLDERAAAQSTPRGRGGVGVGVGVSHSSSATDTESSLQPQYYKQQRGGHHQPPPSGGGHKHPPPGPMRRDTPRSGGDRALAGRDQHAGPALSTSVSGGSAYPARSGPPPPLGNNDGQYSLDQYSHDGSDTASGRYSECSSSYSAEEPPPQRRGGGGGGGGGDPPPSPTHQMRVHQQQALQHQWGRHHEYGRNLQYVNESYGDDSTNE